MPCTHRETEKYYENSLWDRQEPSGPRTTEKHCLRGKRDVHVSVSSGDLILKKKKPSEKNYHPFQKNKIAYFSAEN